MQVFLGLRYRSALGLIAVFMTACSPESKPSMMTDDLIGRVANVTEQTKKACNFIPAVTSIAAILGVPGAPAVDLVAGQICDRVNAVPALESGRPRARDIVVEIPDGEIQGVLLPKE